MSVFDGFAVLDSMISKVMAFGKTRELALDRMNRALGEYLTRGTKPNTPSARAIIQDPHSRAGKATTKYIEEFLERVPKDIYS